MPLTYSSYLKLDALLSLQETLSKGKARDEMLFIIVHQAYELWFKEILHEVDNLRACLESGDLPQSQLILKRIVAVLRVMIAHMDVLETMPSMEFLAFRDLLGSSSGFQSRQFRELEFVLGAKRPEILSTFPEGSPSRASVEERYLSGTLWDSFLRFLALHRYPIPEEVLQRDVTKPVTPSPDVQSVLLDIYYRAPAVTYLCEMLLDLDEAFQQWRYRHVKMVERMIGTKRGTGGSTGVEYLAGTLSRPFFPDLWAIRTEFRRP